jgi:hypothetical protein
MKRQVNLKAKNMRLTTWVDDRKGLIAGAVISLKEYPGTWWNVEFVGRPHKPSDIKRGWSNNI